MFHLMLEQVLLFDPVIRRRRRTGSTAYTLSPGVRGGWNVGEAQLVGGVAVPITWESGDSDTGVFLYAIVRAAVHQEVAARQSSL